MDNKHIQFNLIQLTKEGELEVPKNNGVQTLNVNCPKPMECYGHSFGGTQRHLKGVSQFRNMANVTIVQCCKCLCPNPLAKDQKEQNRYFLLKSMQTYGGHGLRLW